MKDVIKNRIATLSKEIEEHNERYYSDSNPILSDFDFDKLLEELILLEKENPEFLLSDSPSQRVGGTITKEFITVNHRYPFLSLGNTYSEEELSDFDERVRKGLGVETVEYVCELKYDGLAIGLRYQNGILTQGVTRGDGTQGDDVTFNARTIKNIPLRLKKGSWPNDFEIRGEVILPRSIFNNINKEKEELGEAPLANPRNAASGTMKMQDSAVVSSRKLSAYMYMLLGESIISTTHFESIDAARSWGFNIPDYTEKVQGLEGVKKFIQNGLTIASNLILILMVLSSKQIYTINKRCWALLLNLLVGQLPINLKRSKLKQFFKPLPTKWDVPEQLRLLLILILYN